MRDKNFWLQILVSAAIPTALGSALIFVFSQFRERLPDWSYNSIISIVYVVFVIVLCVLVVILIRLAFGDSFTRLWRWLRKRYEYRTNLRRAESLNSKFSQLWGLISEVIDNNWQATQEQINKYFMLHAWFRLHRSKFLSLWYSFEQRRTEPANPRSPLSTNDLEYVVFSEHYRDPFSMFYEPMMLSLLEHSLRRWDKNEIKYVLMKLYELTEEFVEWTCARQ